MEGEKGKLIEGPIKEGLWTILMLAFNHNAGFYLGVK